MSKEDSGKRISSRNWMSDYKKEFGGRTPTLATGAVFSGTSEVGVPIPSGDPALRLPSSSGSRLATFDAVRLASLDSSISTLDTDRIGSFDWYRHLMNDSSSSGDRLTTSDYVTKAILKDDSSNPQSQKKEQPKAKSAPVAKASPATEREYVEEKDIRETDILCGRGGKSNRHVGNKRYRKLVSEMKALYRDTEAKTAKTDLSRSVVEYVHNYNGRFLKKDKDGRYYVMTKSEARKKTSQALRETKILKWTDFDEEQKQGEAVSGESEAV